MSIEKLLNEVASVYQLGEITAFAYIPIGYEDLNIKLQTDKGKYVVKLFSKQTTLPLIQDRLKAQLLFIKTGIPTPTLLKTNQGYLYTKKGAAGKLYLCVMEFFPGKSFNEIPPTCQDLAAITSYIAKIHQLKLKIHPGYDSWGVSHLLEEFPKKKRYLKKADLSLVEPIIEKLALVDFSQFKKSLIHGALEKQNILKNKQGEYCILDFGCLDFNAAVIDLAIFLAAFCLNPDLPQRKNQQIYNFVIRQYLRTNPLSQLELVTIPLLIQSACAAYLLTANYLQVQNHDLSQQTENFLLFGRSGIRTFSNHNLNLLP